MLAVGSFDATISIWLRYANDYECIHELDGHESEVKGIAWDPTGTYLISCSRDKSVWVWSKDEGDDEYYCNGLL